MANATATYKIVLQDRTKRAFKAIGRSLNSIRKSIFSMKTAFISAAGIAGIGFFVKKSMDATDEMAKMSRAIGVSVEELQSLRHAASLGGLEATQLDKAVQKLAINMADMSRGVGLAKDVFEKHNISVKNADGTLRSVMEVMDDVADVTAGMTNQTEKADLAYKLFGARGAKMINMLNGGSEAMREAMKEAERLGLVMSEDTAKGVEDANDAITRLKMFLGATFRRTVAELAPLIQTLTEKIMALVTMKIEDSGGVGEIAKMFATMFIEAGVSILQTFKSVYDGVAQFVFDMKQLIAGEQSMKSLNRDINNFLDLRNKIKTDGLADVGELLYKGVAFLKGEDPLKQVDAILDGLYAKRMKLQELGEDVPTLEIQAFINQLLALRPIYEQTDGAITSVTESLQNQKKQIESEPTVWDHMKAAYEDYADTVETKADSIQRITRGLMQTAEDAIVNMIMGVKTNWKSLFKAIMADIVRIQIRKALVGAFGGFFASGGRPPVGRPSIVGERGAELFVPDSAGTIIPNHQLGGSTQHTTAEINFNVQAIDAASFNSYLVNNRDTIESVINNSLLTNGSVRRTIQMVG